MVGKGKEEAGVQGERGQGERQKIAVPRGWDPSPEGEGLISLEVKT